MNFYRRLTASFWYKGVEYPLYPLYIDENDDVIEVVSPARHPDIVRGCIGDLVTIGVNGVDSDNKDNLPLLEDRHNNVLLGKIQVYSIKVDEAPNWKYIFLKD